MTPTALPPSAFRILALSALRRELYGVVAASLLGSILSNLLLVMGEWRGWRGLGVA